MISYFFPLVNIPKKFYIYSFIRLTGMIKKLKKVLHFFFMCVKIIELSVAIHSISGK